MSAAASPIAHARSFLFVPGDRPERLSKALGSAAHAVIVDLEDAVAPEDKPRARAAIAAACSSLPAVQVARLLVRINAADTHWLGDDLALLRDVARHGLGGVVVPKADAASVIATAADAAGAPVLALIESAAGLQGIDAVARAPGVLRLAFGHLDLQADIGMQCGDDERELDPARLMLAVASRVAGLPKPVDGVTVALDDDARLTADVARSRRFGFGAKLCIHPRQIDAIHAGLGPTPAERAWAQRVLEAAAREPGGAFRLDGQMVDAPVLLRARSYLEAS